jgi:hypothetical protein
MRFLAWTVIVLLIAGALLVARAADVNNSIELRDRAFVTGSRLTLADLLASHLPTSLRAPARAMDLGRAPQPGAVRVLEGDWLRDRLRDSQFAQMLIPERVLVERNPRQAGDRVLSLLKSAVTEYLQRYLEKGSWLETAQFDWPAILPEIPATTSFQVLASQWDSRPQALRLRLGCVPRQTCLPFYVSIYFARHAQPRVSRDMAQRVAGLLPGRTYAAFAVPSEASTAKRASKKPAPVLARPGTLASMIVEKGSIRIFTEVICLDRGVRGDIIRVRNPESKRILRAQVIGPAQVRGPV